MPGRPTHRCILRHRNASASRKKTFSWEPAYSRWGPPGDLGAEPVDIEDLQSEPENSEGDTAPPSTLEGTSCSAWRRPQSAHKYGSHCMGSLSGPRPTADRDSGLIVEAAPSLLMQRLGTVLLEAAKLEQSFEEGASLECSSTASGSCSSSEEDCEALASAPSAEKTVGMRTPEPPGRTGAATPNFAEVCSSLPRHKYGRPTATNSGPSSQTTAPALKHKYLGILGAFPYESLAEYRFPPDSEPSEPCGTDEVWQGCPAPSPGHPVVGRRRLAKCREFSFNQPLSHRARREGQAWLSRDSEASH